jgi:3-oxoacyl-[acyl-carrier protein] reductase
MSLKQYLKRSLRYVLKGVPTYHLMASVTYAEPNAVLHDKKVIVTGGGRGLGFAMAKKFKSEGAEVLIVGRNATKLEESAKELGCSYLVYDVQDVEHMDAFMHRANEILNGANCLINNAGISLHEKSFIDVTPDGFDAQINTNLRGSFFMAQKFIKLLEEENREGNILFVSSETGNTADIRPYGLTKAAINSLVAGLASMYAKKGIRINAIAPGITKSDMTGLGADGNLYYSDNATKRLYLPEEVAECACFLISNMSGCIAGEIITCNNGKTINARWK